MDQRIAREKAFHDSHFARGGRAKADGFYDIVEPARACYRREVTRLCPPGAAMLEYGVGLECYAIPLAGSAESVTGIDISPVAVSQAVQLADEKGVRNARFLEMNAEELEFESGSFDLVCGTGIIHHLDLDRAYSEAARVLKPGGSAVFYEPLGHNPLINAYRNRTPDLRTPDEHPLLDDDILKSQRCFARVRCRYFCLCSLASLPFRNVPGFNVIAAALNGLDRAILTVMPPLRKYSWIVVMTLSEPITSPSPP